MIGSGVSYIVGCFLTLITDEALSVHRSTKAHQGLMTGVAVVHMVPPRVVGCR